ncbi:MAG: hypothetical protein LLG02_08810 [Pelosinus sp.]|nr:hypothetical protein [Pelosinus sp.]
MVKTICAALLTALLFTGCVGKPVDSFPAALKPLPPEEAANWLNQENLLTTGSGNTARVLVHGEDKVPIRELAAGGAGQLEYFAEVTADQAATATAHFDLLSTQGSGRVKLSALDQNGNVLGAVGYVFTGNMPPDSENAKWLDLRYNTNYKGGWRQENYRFSEVFAKNLPKVKLERAGKYRITLESGEGQHVLFDDLTAQVDQSKMVRLTPAAAHYQANLGETVTLEADVENISKLPLAEISVNFHEPPGYGIVANDQTIMLENLAAAEKRHISLPVTAKRPDSVNFNKPWQVGLTVGDDSQSAAEISISVTDPKPGKVFYVMTEDLEPIDSAGYPVRWGNGDGWLQPEEFTFQLVHKSEKLNAVAAKYGAKWTHYIAWPAVVAAEWADTQSKTGDWKKAVTAIKASVESQTLSGHEYGVHMHTDYDPYLPENAVSYQAQTDGLWANHLRHGWAHDLSKEGDYADRDSRTGSLYQYKKILDELMVESPGGQSLTARAGSFDFGSGSEEEAKSIRACRKVGIWGSSDADGNQEGLTAGNFGKEVYFTSSDDINIPAQDISNIGIVEVRPTPRDFIAYDKQLAAAMNQRVDQGMNYFAPHGIVMPGVHAIVGFTHAMFMMGEPDWKSTDGGMFTILDEHLSYIKEHYVEEGAIEFGTASELVKSYLDYYTPELMAVYGRRLSAQWWGSEYAVELLGKDIPVDASRPHKVTVKYPLYLRDSAYRISILKNGQPIYTTWGIPTPFNDICFNVDDKTAVYTMKIYHNPTVYKMTSKVKMAIKYIKGK